MTKNTKDLYSDFFEGYSKNVDNADNCFFWKLSDRIILEIIKKYITSVSENTLILDAGGGTGRWIQILGEIYNAKFVLFDKYEDMLNMARGKKALNKIDNRLQIIKGDIQNMYQIKSDSVDYLVSIYNPISFVEKPILFFNEIKRILKSKGIGLVMGQGYYNAIASKINNYQDDAVNLNKLVKDEKVKWSESLAPLHVFSKESLEKLAIDSRLTVLKTYGIPVFIQPGPEDFDSENKKRSRVSSKLETDSKFFEEIFRIEMKYNSQESIINRGMNLFTVFKKL